MQSSDSPPPPTHRMAFVGRAVEDPIIIDRVAAVLHSQWDATGAVRDALRGGPPTTLATVGRSTDNQQ